PYSRDGKSVEFHFSVITFLNEEYLAAAAGHLGRFGIEPTGTRGVARTGFFELTRDFPRGFVFRFICSSKRGPNAEKTCNKRTREERYCLHNTEFYGPAGCEQPLTLNVMHQKAGLPAVAWVFERVTRLELATSSLARRCSTTELHPHFTGKQ